MTICNGCGRGMPAGYLMTVLEWGSVEVARDPSPGHSIRVLKPAAALCRDCSGHPRPKPVQQAIAIAGPAPSSWRSDAAKRAWVTIRANRAAKGAQ